MITCFVSKVNYFTNIISCYFIFLCKIYISSIPQIEQFTRLICQRLYKKPTTFHQAKTKSANQASNKCQQKQTPNQKKQKKETCRTIESIVLHVLICLMFSYMALYSFILPCTFCSPKQYVFVTYQPMPACKCDKACLARIMARRCFSYKEW